MLLLNVLICHRCTSQIYSRWRHYLMFLFPKTHKGTGIMEVSTPSYTQKIISIFQAVSDLEEEVIVRRHVLTSNWLAARREGEQPEHGKNSQLTF